MTKELKQVRTSIAAVLVAGAMLVGGAVGLAAAALADDEPVGSPPTADRIEPQDALETAAAASAANPPSGGAPDEPRPPDVSPAPAMVGEPTINAAEAGRIAAAHVGGRVDDVERDADDGAAWEVDVYAPEGEYEVYVDAMGAVVRSLGPYTD